MALAEQERAYWKAYIEQWKESHQTSNKFCHEHDLDFKIFNAWRKKLWREDKETQSGRVAAPHFIPVIETGIAPRYSEIKLELRDGVRVCWQISGFTELAQQLREMALL